MARLRRVDRSIEIKFLADMKEVVAASKATQATLGGVSGQAMRFNNVVGAVSMFADFAQQGVDAFFDLARAASNYDQAVGKSRAVFGEYSADVEKMAETAATAWGQSKTAVVDYAGTIGNMLTAQGIATDEAKDMSLAMVRLAADISAFSNIDIGEALTAIRAGLSGETEPLRRFGVNILDAEVKLQALTEGIWDGTGAMTAQQKVLGRYYLLLKQTKNMVGSFAREQDTLQTQSQILNAEIENLKISLGEGGIAEGAVNIVRGLGSLVGGLNDATDALKRFNKESEKGPMAEWLPGGGSTPFDWGNTFFLFGPLGLIGKMGEESAKAAPKVDDYAGSTTEAAVAAAALAAANQRGVEIITAQVEALKRGSEAIDADTRVRRDRLAVLEEEASALAAAWGKLDDPTLRQQLRQFGKNGMDELAKAFRSKDPEMRARAEDAAVKYGNALVAAGKRFKPTGNPVIDKWIKQGIEEAEYKASLDALLTRMQRYLNSNPLNISTTYRGAGSAAGSGPGGPAPEQTSAPVVNVYSGVGDPVQIGRQVSKVLGAYTTRGGSSAPATTFGLVR
jgi:hypothetical protein